MFKKKFEKIFSPQQKVEETNKIENNNEDVEMKDANEKKNTVDLSKIKFKIFNKLDSNNGSENNASDSTNAYKILDSNKKNI